MYVYMYVCMYVCMYVYMYVCMYVCNMGSQKIKGTTYSLFVKETGFPV